MLIRDISDILLLTYTFYFARSRSCIERCQVIKKNIFFYLLGNVRAAETHKHPFLVLSNRHADCGESINVFAVPFRNAVARLEHREDTLSSNEEILVFGVARNGKEATKGRD